MSSRKPSREPPTSRTSHATRVAGSADAPEIARLLTLLGHPTPVAQVERWWELWTGTGGSALVAGEERGSLAGVATLQRIVVLHRPRPVGRITSLVVEERLRGQGIGRALVHAAERALAEAGCGLLEITSNLRRESAHSFYEGLGYERTSFRFAKTLATGQPSGGILPTIEPGGIFRP